MSLLEVYKKNSGVLGEIYQNLVIQWRDEQISMRRFKSPISVRNVSNNLDDATVETLLSVCRRNAIVFQDYFKEKAKMLDVKKLQRYHLYAPLSLKTSDQKKFAYTKAQILYSKHLMISIHYSENLLNESLMNNMWILKLEIINKGELFVRQYA